MYVCDLTLCVSTGFSGCCCQGDPTEWKAGGGRADPQSDPVLPSTALPTQQRPAERTGGESGTLVHTHTHTHFKSSGYSYW